VALDLGGGVTAPPAQSDLGARVAWAAAPLSAAVLFDLLLSMLCQRLPAVMYLAAAAAAVPAWFLPRLLLSHASSPAPLPIGLGVVAAAAALLLLASPPFEVDEGGLPPGWSSHCGWKFCGQVFGPSLGDSPFPVGTPSCAAYAMCAEEYRYSGDQQEQLTRLMKSQGCSAPYFPPR
jgi:hypothetical protein